jgi:hypothetical protein
LDPAGLSVRALVRAAGAVRLRHDGQLGFTEAWRHKDDGKVIVAQSIARPAS